MIITCGECDSSFILDDSLVKATGTKVRCSNCKHVFVVYPAKPTAGSEKPVAARQSTEGSYDYDDDPDLSKAVAAIDESDLAFTDDELGIVVENKVEPPVKAAAATAPEFKAPEIPIPVPVPEPPAFSEPEPVSMAIEAEEKSMAGDEDILDFADFELDMDEMPSDSEVSASVDEELDLNLEEDEEPGDFAAEIEEELDLQLDSGDEEELDFSDLELELDGGMKDTEVIGVSMTKDETDAADTMVVEELQFDLQDEDFEPAEDKAGPPPLPEEDFAFEAESAEKEADAEMMIDDELDFSDLERELDGISDEPAAVDELDLGFDTDEESVEAETILMDGDDLDFSEFELDAEGDKPAGKGKKSEEASAEDELDFSSLSTLLDSEPPPADDSKDSDEDLELELDFDLDAEPDSSRGGQVIDEEEEELDFSDLEDLLDDLEKADAAGKSGVSEDLDLELDGAMDEDAAQEKAAVMTHDEEDLDFSDVEAMLDLDEGLENEEFELEGAEDSDFDLELEMEGAEDGKFVRLGDEEDPDIELELDLGDEDQAEDEENELLELEEDDDEDNAAAMIVEPGRDEKSQLAGKTEEKKKAKPKPKRKAPGRGKSYVKYAVIALIVMLVLFVILYLAKGVIEKTFNVEIPVSIPVLEPLSQSVSGMMGGEDKDAQGKFKLKTSGITGKIIPSAQLGDLFVISGNVQNTYPDTRNSISLVCKLFGKGGSVSQTKLFYAGNVIPEAELVNMTDAMIMKRIQNRLGDNGVNAKVRPNQVIPFMVIFTRLGDNLTEFSVEPAGSLKGDAMP